MNLLLEQEQTLKAFLTQAKQRLAQAGLEEPYREAIVLAQKVLKRDPAYCFSHQDDLIDSTQWELLLNALKRRENREPIEYIFGSTEFYGLSFEVQSGLLCPRPDSETLVEAVLQLLQQHQKTKAIDLCCGTGCLGTSIAKHTKLPFDFLDINPKAIDCTQKNTSTHNLLQNSKFFNQDLLSFQSTIPYDLVIYNPPYLSQQEYREVAPELKNHEDPRALIGGPQNGLEFFFKSLNILNQICLVGADIFVELGAEHYQLITATSLAPTFNIVRWHRDLAGHHRVLHMKKGSIHG